MHPIGVQQVPQMAENDTETQRVPYRRVTGPGEAEPEFARIAAAERITGLNRNTLYALARDGKIKAKKISYRTTLVDLASVRAFIASAPDA